MATSSVPDYFDRHNPDLLALIPPDAKTILEVGCGAGKLAEMYRRTNPGVNWCGYERDVAASRVALDRGFKVRRADIEDVPLGLWLDAEESDVLIFGDVLEHLRDPWGTLQSLADTYLKPGGLVLACIPNIQHYSILLNLLRGQWRYQDEGLLDRTHLRFFTLEGVKQLFESAGLDIFEVRGRKAYCDLGQWHEFLDLIAPDVVGNLQKMGPFEAYQWIVRARKPGGPAIEPLHIHAVTAEECCARPRIREPFAALATIPGVRCTTGPFIDAGAHIAILQRPRFPIVNSLAVARAHAKDRLLIAELDDHPAYLQGMEQDDFLALRAVHAVQVSTEALVEVVRPDNPHVMVFPNQIAELPSWEEKPKRDEIRIFFGAQNRQEDWAVILGSLHRSMDEQGVRNMAHFEVVHDREFFEALRTDRKTFHPFLPYDQYRQLIRSCDIALLPLEDTEFNRRKSDLKFLECAAEGTAVITTPWGPAKDSTPYARREQRAALYEYPHEFEAALEALVNSADYRKMFAQNAYAYVRDHRMLGQHYRRQHEWYLSLLTRKSELDQSLRRRVPELFD